MKRAIGIVRVSQTNGREGESFASPKDQQARIRAACEREGLRLLDVYEELDVSGRTPLRRRPGLSQAVRAVEEGTADTIVVAYFDRLVRSIKVQAEVVSRVEKAGGDVLTVDFGAITNGSAVQKMTSHFLGAVAQYVADASGERSRDAQTRAVARGVLPAPTAPPGYRRGEDGVLVKTRQAPIMVEAFDRRAAGASVTDVRAFLAEHGIRRSYSTVTALLSNRLYVGEIHFGETSRSGDEDGKKSPLVNLAAHEGIIDRDVFEKCQRTRATGGRPPGKAQAQRLLPRLGVLRCSSCGSRMVLGGGNSGNSFYICGHVATDCPSRAAITAQKVEEMVISAVKEAVAGMRGTASTDGGAAQAAVELEKAQARLDAAVEAFAELMAEPAAVKKLGALREARDAARDRLEELTANSAATTVALTAEDWEDLSLAAQRALVKAVVARVTVAPGRGPEKVTIELAK